MRFDGRCEQHGNPIVSSDGKCEMCYSSPRTSGWSASEPRQMVKTKTIEYECGCSMTLSMWSMPFAEECCHEHLKPIKKITTVEEFI